MLKEFKEFAVKGNMVGLFINALIAFVIVALVLFLVIKAMNRMKREEEAAEPDPEPEPTKEEVLLTEIRDVLRAQATS